MNTPTKDLTSSFLELEEAYKQAYAEAQVFDELNRLLVHHYIAKSSRAAADALRLRANDPALADQARAFADSAAREDTLTAGTQIAKYLYKFLPAGILITASAAVGAFFLTLLGDFHAGGQEAGAQLVKLFFSGALVFGAFQVLVAIGRGAADALGEIAEDVKRAFASNRDAKRVIASLSVPEARVFGVGQAPRQARSGRLVVNAAGPAVGTVLAVLVAIPIALAASGLAGLVSGIEEGARQTTTTELPEPDVNLPPELTSPSP